MPIWIFFISFLTLHLNAHNLPMEEEFFILDPKHSYLEKLSQMPEMVIDHPDEYGFELFGPKGTEQWLQENEIPYSLLTEQESTTSTRGYPNYQQMTEKLQKLANDYPEIFHLFSIGQSVEGRELWVMKVSNSPREERLLPEFKYISSMHGDEITGRDLMIMFLEEIAENAKSDPRIQLLLENTEIYIMPSMNPDGSERRSRFNANRIDLNRNFPDFTRRSHPTAQPETQAVMNFQSQRRFALSANFHSGAVVVNYPWDTVYEKHPLDELIRHFSLEYAQLNPAMRNSTRFPLGVVNGAQWYVLKGGMQDWSYHWHQDLQVTVELSNPKWPAFETLPEYYRDNRNSLYRYLELVHQGYGVYAKGKKGTVRIHGQQGEDYGEYSFDQQFYKVLPIGHYHFHVQLAAGESYQFAAQVTDEINSDKFYVIP